MQHHVFVKPALLAAALLLAGCGDRAWSAAVEQPPAATTAALMSPSPAVGTASDAAARRDQVFVRQAGTSADDRLVVLAGVDGGNLRELPFGVPAPDWSVLYTADSSDGRTIVRALDTASGRVLRETALDGTYDLPVTTLDRTPGGLSPDGKWLALAGVPAMADQRAYGKHPKTESRFVVLDTMFERPVRSLLLNGTFSFDAISNSGQSLFLIEHLVPEQPDEYQVRVYHLAAGVLDQQVIADKRRAPQLMAGTRHSTVAAPDGGWLYSVYLNAHHGPFIHALNLNDAYALCIFLPAQAKDDWQRQRQWAVAMKRDGVLYAVNGALGLVAEVDRSSNSVARSAELGIAQTAAPSGPLPQLAPPAGAAQPAIGGAALSPDSKTLWASGDNGLLAVATADFSLRGHYLTDLTFSSIALSADGERIYAVDAGRDAVLRIDAASGTVAEQVQLTNGTAQMLRIETRRNP